MNKNFLGNFSSRLRRLGAGLTLLVCGVPRLTAQQERLLLQMEKDYERAFGKPGALKTDLKKLGNRIPGRRSSVV